MLVKIKQYLKNKFYGTRYFMFLYTGITKKGDITNGWEFFTLGNVRLSTPTHEVITQNVIAYEIVHCITKLGINVNPNDFKVYEITKEQSDELNLYGRKTIN